MSDQPQIIPPSIFVWDLDRPNIGKLIIHTMYAANDLYTRGDVYDYGPPGTEGRAELKPINVEGLGLKARTKADIPVYVAPDTSKPFIRNGIAKVVSHMPVDIFEVSAGWFRVFPPKHIQERPMWVQIKDCVRYG